MTPPLNRMLVPLQSAPFEAFDEQKILGKYIEIGKKIEAEQFEPDTTHCATCAFRNRCAKSICVDSEPDGPDFSGNTPA